MAEKWFKQRNSFYIRIPASSPNGTDEIIWRSLTHRQFSILYFFIFGSSTLVSVTGIFTNLINIVIFLKVKVKEGVDVSLLSLSISDFIFTFFKSARNISSIFLTTEMYTGPCFGIDPELFEYFSSGIAVTVYTHSTLIIIVLALVRCICVLMPLRFKNSFTPRTCGAIISVCALISVALNLPSVAAVDVVPKFVKLMNQSRLARYNYPIKKKLRDVVQLTTHLAIPLTSQIILVNCVFVMLWAMKRSASFRQQATSVAADKEKQQLSEPKGKLSPKELQVVRQVLLVCLLFLLCNTPDVMYGVVTYFFPQVQTNGKKFGYIRMYKVLKQVRHFFMSVNGSVNMIIYLRYNRKYREYWAKNIKSGVRAKEDGEAPTIK